MNLTDAQAFLTTLMRTIDRKTTVTLEPTGNRDVPAIIVKIVRDRRVGQLHINEATLAAAQANVIQRNRLRTQLKHVRDGMWDSSMHIFSTKMQRPANLDGASFYRSQGGGGNRGGRR